MAQEVRIRRGGRLAWTVAAATLAATAASAEEKRELGAHQHGHSALNIAIEGDSVVMELEAPGADIVGFEHPATTDEHRAAIDAAKATLSKPLELFVAPAAAGCAVSAVEVALVDNHGDDHDDHGHDDHGHDDHGHDEHAEAKHGDDDHAHGEHAHEEHGHDEHAHDEKADGDQHTEFRAEYALACSDPSALSQIDFAYFDAFPNAQEVDVQLISDKGSRGYEVERDAPKLDLSGAI